MVFRIKSEALVVIKFFMADRGMSFIKVFIVEALERGLLLAEDCQLIGHNNKSTVMAPHNLMVFINFEGSLFVVLFYIPLYNGHRLQVFYNYS